MNTRLLQASGLTAVLIFAMVGTAISQQQPAFAQTADIGGIEHRIVTICANGSVGTPGTTFLPFTLSGFQCTESNPIASIVFQTWALFYSNDYTVSGSSFPTPTIKVLARDGTYKTISGSGGPTFERVYPPANTVWRLYQVQLLVTSIEQAIGTGIEDYTGEIRVTSPAFSFNIKSVSTGATRTVPMTSATTSWNALKQEGTTSGGCIGTACTELPSGKFYYNIVIEWLDGTKFTHTSTDIRNFPPLSVSTQGQGLYDGREFKSITYNLRLLVDNDIWNIYPVVKFVDNPAAIGNWQAYVENNPVAKTPQTQLIARLTGTAPIYKVITMTVLASDIEPMLSVVSESAGQQIRSGTLKFTVNHAKIDFQSTTGTYPVDLPAQTVTINLGGYTPIIDDDPGDCNIVNGQTICPEPERDLFDQIGKFFGDMFNVDETTGLVLFGVMVAVILGIVLLVASAASKSHARGPRDFRERLKGF